MVVQLNQANSYRFSTDEALLDDIKQSDHVAFEYLFKRYYPRLLGYAVRFMQDEDMARDILQECFMTFWERRHLLAAVSLSSLLFLMVRNACLNYLKHSALVRHIPIDYLNELNGEEKLYSADLMLSADEPVLYEDLKRQIDDALSHLSPRSREIFLLSRFKGLKNREIAECFVIRLMFSLYIFPFYVFRPKNVRFPNQNRTFSIPKPYGFGTETIKGRWVKAHYLTKKGMKEVG